MTGKSILLLYPHNFTDVRLGVNQRFAGIIRYLNASGFAVDLLAMSNFKSKWPAETIKKGLPGIRNLYLYNHSAGLKSAFIRNLTSFDLAANRNLLGKKITSLPDYSFSGLRKMFNRIVAAHSYGFILISYIQWAKLLDGFDHPGITKVLTIEDSLSTSLVEQFGNDQLRAAFLEEEARRIMLFDHVVCISMEEMELFSQKAPGPGFHFVPVFLDPNPKPVEKEPEYDILFVGSDHPSNQKGIRWFFDHVFPLLSPELKILCVGSIVRFVPDKVNVVKIGFADDLHTLYHKARLTINPLLDGTGMKVKLIESLAHGVPVVTTTAGLSGISPDLKRQFMVGDQPSEFAAAIDQLISDNGLYLDYSENLNRIFNEHFTTDVAARTLDTIFTG